jgi:ElaB/YqjD/DUF883 family membrane-anchored ribosome-binding protein
MNKHPTAVDNEPPSLAPTRVRLLNYLAALDRVDSKAADRHHRNAGDAQHAPAAKADVNWTALLESGLSRWWHDHPGRATALVAKAGIEEFARRKPVQAVAAAAAVGAVLVLLRPWRLVSVAALAATVIRSSNLNGVVGSIFDTALRSSSRKKHDNQR